MDRRVAPNGSFSSSLFFFAFLLMSDSVLTSRAEATAHPGAWHTIPNAWAKGSSDSTFAWDVIRSGKLIGERPDSNGRGGGTHAALLRGNGDSTWVLHFDQGNMARVWLVENTAGGGIDTVTVAYGVPLQRSVMEPFCGGHSHLADGRLLVMGGTLIDVPSGDRPISQNGTQKTIVFDAKEIHSSSKGWSVRDEMTHPRWYGTALALSDGKVIAASGNMAEYLLMFGGKTPDSLANDLRTAKRFKDILWEPDSSRWVKPTHRWGHTLTFIPATGFYVVYGGLDSYNSYLADATLRVFHNPENDIGVERVWQPFTPTGVPAGRAWHTACSVPLADSMYVFGGLTNGGAADSSKLLILDSLQANHRWLEKTIQPDENDGMGPPRYGHTAVLDHSVAWQDSLRPRMLFFGGRRDTNSLVDNAVWELQVPWSPVDTVARWKKLWVSGTPPCPREGHVMVRDNVPRDETHQHMLNQLFAEDHDVVRFFMHGGKDASGTLLNDTWALVRDEVADTAAVNWRWVQITTTGTAPPPIWRHAAVHDQAWDNLRIFGGDTLATDGGESNRMWRLGLVPELEATFVWTAVTQTDPPAPRSGHAMVADERSFLARRPEIFNPTSGSIGDWSVMGDSAQKRMPYYPQLHQLGNGKLFWAGNGGAKTSWVLDLSTGYWSEADSSGFRGGSSILIATQDSTTLDKVMKAGGPGSALEGEAEGTTRVARVTLASTSVVWSPYSFMPEGEGRHFHNLTILPNGEVLMTGGLNELDGPPEKRTPRLWNPLVSLWRTGATSQASFPLTDDPLPRKYHSTALLLPDARVLSASGYEDHHLEVFPQAAIYSPPYLYVNSSGDSAIRPVITGGCNTIGYGEAFGIGFDGVSEIDEVVLMRPGAPTHAFNPDQRRMDLGFMDYDSLLIIQMSSNANRVPPGDYMLFLLRQGVPSVAKWVRVQIDAVPPPTPSDFGVTFVNETTIQLDWTAPGAGGTCGRPIYDLRWSANPITNGTEFNSANVMSMGYPAETGATDIAQLTGLSTCTLRYFALKVFDAAGNSSSMVTAEGMTTAGFGEFCMDPLTSGGLEEERVSGSLDSGLAPDAAAVPPVKFTTQSEASPGFILEPLPGEDAAWRIRGLSAADVRAFGVDSTQSLLLGVVSGESAAYERITGLAGDVGVVSSVRSDRRVVGLGRVVLRGIEPNIKVGETGVASLSSAWHSRDGDVLSAVDDSGQVSLQPGDTLDIRYELVEGEGAPALTTDYFLSIDAGPEREHQMEEERLERSAPIVFALHQNRPNPFAEATTFQFDLPRAERVTLDVLDIQGRRVARLVDGPYEAGYHSVTWDRRSRSLRANPGVYFYRLVAGTFQARRKLVVLP